MSIKEKTGFWKKHLLERRMGEFCRTSNSSFSFQSPCLEAVAPSGGIVTGQRKNLQRLMMEHNRGWAFCCLITRDTFGSLITAEVNAASL